VLALVTAAVEAEALFVAAARFGAIASSVAGFCFLMYLICATATVRKC
jgi:hypothetical protein